MYLYNLTLFQYFTWLVFWPQSHLTNGVAQDSGLIKPSGQTGSEVELPD